MTTKISTLVLELAEAVDNAANDIGGSRGQLDILKDAVQEATNPTPIDMVLHCPLCRTQHIDAPEERDALKEFKRTPEPWTNPPHRSHLCARCGHIWRPADVPTNGVAKIKTRGKADSRIAEPATFSVVGVKPPPVVMHGGWARITPDRPAMGLRVEVRQYQRSAVVAVRTTLKGLEPGFYEVRSGAVAMVRMRPQPTLWRELK